MLELKIHHMFVFLKKINESIFLMFIIYFISYF